MMKQRFIRRFIITEETCTIGVLSAKREGIYIGENKSLPFYHRRYLCHTRKLYKFHDCWKEEDAVSLLGCLHRSVRVHRGFVC